MNIQNKVRTKHENFGYILYHASHTSFIQLLSLYSMLLRSTDDIENRNTTEILFFSNLLKDLIINHYILIVVIIYTNKRIS